MSILAEFIEHFQKDTGELQNVLTRYVDSFDGYLQASQLIEHPGYSSAFLEIADRRKSIVSAVAKLIAKQADHPDERGSAEAALHRWWMKVRVAMTEDELRALLQECIRGESELLRTVNSALHHGDLKPAHYQLLAAVGAEVEMAINTFETALNL